jgi:hypothetical protein
MMRSEKEVKKGKDKNKKEDEKEKKTEGAYLKVPKS